MAWCAGPAGVEEQGIGTRRLPRNLGRPGILHTTLSGWRPDSNSRPAGHAFGTGGSELPAHVVVSPSEGQRSAARRGQGIGVPHSTVEPGELEPWGPGGGKEAPRGGIDGRQQPEDIEPRSAVHVSPSDSVAACQTTTRRAVCLNWASTDQWEPQEATPGATRPIGLSPLAPGLDQIELHASTSASRMTSVQHYSAQPFSARKRALINMVRRRSANLLRKAGVVSW